MPPRLENQIHSTWGTKNSYDPTTATATSKSISQKNYHRYQLRLNYTSAKKTNSWQRAAAANNSFPSGADPADISDTKVLRRQKICHKNNSHARFRCVLGGKTPSPFPNAPSRQLRGGLAGGKQTRGIKKGRSVIERGRRRDSQGDRSAGRRTAEWWGVVTTCGYTR